MKRIMRHDEIPLVSTYSIVAYDEATAELGVAVQSKFLAVGAVVPHASAGVGAIATQSFSNTSFGPRSLAALQLKTPPEDVLADLLRDDPARELRQVGIVNARGQSATFTGKDCFPYAGGIAEHGFAAQGNTLHGPDVIEAIAQSYRSSKGPLAERLIAALAAGQAAGGDRRGMQSASLLIVRENGGYGGFNDRAIDLRVDDHDQPITELARLLTLHRLYFERTRKEDRLPLAGEYLEEVTVSLRALGYPPALEHDMDAVKKALFSYIGTENFDERWSEDAIIDRKVLEFMRNQIATQKNGSHA
ncbi:DUF1028 domain-containing protein [Ferroacidibacillus organovorans]